jgi:hypothetical protein
MRPDPLPDSDLNEVHEYYATLREVFILNPGGWEDSESLARVQRICRAGMAAIADGDCRARLARVEAQAAELYSRHGHERWTRRTMSGADYLRLQALISLEALNARLYLLEALRKRAPLQRPHQNLSPAFENERVTASRK